MRYSLKVVITFHLIFVTWETLRLECLSCVLSLWCKTYFHIHYLCNTVCLSFHYSLHSLLACQYSGIRCPAVGSTIRFLVIPFVLAVTGSVLLLCIGTTFSAHAWRSSKHKLLCRFRKYVYSVHGTKRRLLWNNNCIRDNWN